jgi:hypothetical protein
MDRDKEDALEEARQAVSDGADLLDDEEAILDDANALLNPENHGFGDVDVMGDIVDEDQPDAVPFNLPPQPPQTYVDVHQRLNDNLKLLNKDQQAAFDVAKASIDKFNQCRKDGRNYKNSVQFISGPGYIF